MPPLGQPLLAYFAAEKQAGGFVAVLGVEAAEVVLLLAGAAMALFLRARSMPWAAVGAGLVVEPAVMLVFDLFAEQRALVYTRWLTSLLSPDVAA